MSAIRARVQNGRLVLDAPTVERAALNAAISKAWASVQSGRARLGSEVLAALRKR